MRGQRRNIQNCRTGSGSVSVFHGGIITDLVCVILGVVLFLMSGGSASQIPTIAGIGTIITAFFMGPLIEFFNVHIARPVLAGKKTEKE